jgi:SAM-dependent methyltransferase
VATPAPKPRTLDALTSGTLKHVRDEWWGDEFTAFLVDHLRPRVGNRILDVGCGTGSAEIRLSRLRIPQVIFIGIDRNTERTIVAERTTDGHNLRASFAAADACRLPFPDASFDSTFCVAVLQHISQPAEALAEFARVTTPGGRILAVEPDNASVYWYSSAPEGMEAFRAGRRFFDALAASRGESGDARIGPRLPTLFLDAGIEPLTVHPFPVSLSRLGAPAKAVWSERMTAIEADVASAPNEAVRTAGDEYLRALQAYERASATAGAGFVELQSTLLFAVVGQRADDRTA